MTSDTGYVSEMMRATAGTKVVTLPPDYGRATPKLLIVSEVVGLPVAVETISVAPDLIEVPR